MKFHCLLQIQWCWHALRQQTGISMQNSAWRYEKVIYRNDKQETLGPRKAENNSSTDDANCSLLNFPRSSSFSHSKLSWLVGKDSLAHLCLIV